MVGHPAGVRELLGGVGKKKKKRVGIGVRIRNAELIDTSLVLCVDSGHLSIRSLNTRRLRFGAIGSDPRNAGEQHRQGP